MKKVFTFLLSFVITKSFSQVIADPAIDQLRFTNVAGVTIADTLPLGYVAQLNIPIRNLNLTSALPAGSCKIKIGLGSKIILDPAFQLSMVNTSQYFDWTAELNSGQVQITGDLKMDLPANFSDTAKFNIQGSILDYSTVTTNFLVTNHNTPVILSDGDPANNSSFRPYKIVEPITTPVNLSKILAVKKDCSVEVSFTAENEINVASFTIEASKDGINFTSAAAITASNRLQYKINFPVTAATSASALFIRIKSTDRDGSYQYSPVKVLNTICGKKISLGIYPNPYTSGSVLTVKAVDGLLDGKYKVIVYNAKGQTILIQEMSVSSQQQIIVNPGNIAVGDYLLKIIGGNDPVDAVFKIQKQ